MYANEANNLFIPPPPPPFFSLFSFIFPPTNSGVAIALLDTEEINRTAGTW